VRFDFSEPVRTRRQKAGLSMRELAERAQVSKPQVVELENRLVCPQLDTLVRIARALRTSAPALIREAKVIENG
jgi:transcriptional regulator with XRE-family HTH domain